MWISPARHPNSRLTGAKKSYQTWQCMGCQPCLGWRPVLIGNRKQPVLSSQLIILQNLRTWYIFPSTGLCLVAVKYHHSLKSECSVNAAKEIAINLQETKLWNLPDLACASSILRKIHRVALQLTGISWWSPGHCTTWARMRPKNQRSGTPQKHGTASKLTELDGNLD